MLQRTNGAGEADGTELKEEVTNDTCGTCICLDIRFEKFLHFILLDSLIDFKKLTYTKWWQTDTVLLMN